MSLQTFFIMFDKPNAVYVAGETVSGKIVLQLGQEKKVRGLLLSVRGESRVHWTESRTVRDSKGHNTTRHDTYTNSEKYFNFEFSIVGSSRSDSRTIIAAGYYEYPFRFELPYNIPSSFEHQYGHVRYTVKAVIDRPWKFDHETKRAFTVVATLDLNDCRAQCLGINDDIHNEFYNCCCCCSNGSMDVQVQLPVSGYVPGQTINTWCSYNNCSSSVQITKICVKLMRLISFYSSSPSSKVKRESNEIKSTTYSGPFTNRGEAVMDILVPPIPPSNLQFCNIIDLKYTLAVVVHVSGLHQKIVKDYVILIGTTPLYIEQGPSAMPMPTLRPSAPLDDQKARASSSSTDHPIGFVPPAEPSTSNNWNIPPPSYEECVSKADNIKDSDESSYVIGANDPFAPRYPVFNYPAPSIHGR
nr:PREDICTED: arrestin domain-containing protein 3-like [Megachile rotundata]